MVQLQQVNRRRSLFYIFLFPKNYITKKKEVENKKPFVFCFFFVFNRHPLEETTAIFRKKGETTHFLLCR